MKKELKYIIAVVFLSLSISYAQTVSYDIELSKPGSMGMLKVDVYNASIRVVGAMGGKAKITIIDKRKGKDKNYGPAEFYYEIIEDNNVVTILNRKRKKIDGLELEISIPQNFSINVSTYFGPKIEVEGIMGEVNVSGYSTDLSLTDLNNSVIANTNHGNVLARIDKFTDTRTYFISSYKGDIEIFLPNNVQATLFMDNGFGNYSSEFELTLDTSKQKNSSTDQVIRKINGGGNELKLINYFGEIIIRKAN